MFMYLENVKVSIEQQTLTQPVLNRVLQYEAIRYINFSLDGRLVYRIVSRLHTVESRFLELSISQTSLFLEPKVVSLG